LILITTFVNQSVKMIDEGSGDMDIKMKIRHYRKLKNLTQKELGERSGLSEATIKKYESGEREPTPQSLEQIERVLGIVSDRMLISDSDAKKLIAYFETLNKSGRDHVLEYVEIISEIDRFLIK